MFMRKVIVLFLVLSTVLTQTINLRAEVSNNNNLMAAQGCSSYYTAIARADGSFDNYVCYSDFNAAKNSVNTMTSDASQTLVVIRASDDFVLYARHGIVEIDNTQNAINYYLYHSVSDTKMSSYFNPGSQYDAPLIDTVLYNGNFQYKIMVAGDIGYLKQTQDRNQVLRITPYSQIKKVAKGAYTDLYITRYQATDKFNYYNLIGKGTYSYADNGYNGWPANISANSGVYFSYDNVYYYSSFITMLNDYRNGVRSNSVNPNKPFYDYYRYLPGRSISLINADTLNAYVANNLSAANYATSVMANSGSAFTNNQLTHAINSSLTFSIGVLESGFGTSSISKSKKNLFGINAYDIDPSGNATAYASVSDCINSFMKLYLNVYYMNYTSTNTGRYVGGYLGNKANGMSVQWASDPAWAFKIAKNYRRLDELTGSIDLDLYQLGVFNGEKKNVYADATSGTILYTSPTSSSWKNYSSTGVSFIVVAKVGSRYKVVVDRESLNRDYKYGYVNISDITLINTGKYGFVDPRTVDPDTGVGVVDEPYSRLMSLSYSISGKNIVINAIISNDNSSYYTYKLLVGSNSITLTDQDSDPSTTTISYTLPISTFDNYANGSYAITLQGVKNATGDVVLTSPIKSVNSAGYKGVFTNHSIQIAQTTTLTALVEDIPSLLTNELSLYVSGTSMIFSGALYFDGYGDSTLSDSAKYLYVKNSSGKVVATQKMTNARLDDGSNDGFKYTLTPSALGLGNGEYRLSIGLAKSNDAINMTKDVDFPQVSKEISFIIGAKKYRLFNKDGYATLRINDVVNEIKTDSIKFSFDNGLLKVKGNAWISDTDISKSTSVRKYLILKKDGVEQTRYVLDNTYSPAESEFNIDYRGFEKTIALTGLEKGVYSVELSIVKGYDNRQAPISYSITGAKTGIYENSIITLESGKLTVTKTSDPVFALTNFTFNEEKVLHVEGTYSINEIQQSTVNTLKKQFVLKENGVDVKVFDLSSAKVVVNGVEVFDGFSADIDFLGLPNGDYETYFRLVSPTGFIYKDTLLTKNHFDIKQTTFKRFITKIKIYNDSNNIKINIDTINASLRQLPTEVEINGGKLTIIGASWTDGFPQTKLTDTKKQLSLRDKSGKVVKTLDLLSNDSMAVVEYEEDYKYRGYSIEIDLDSLPGGDYQLLLVNNNQGFINQSGVLGSSFYYTKVDHGRRYTFYQIDGYMWLRVGLEMPLLSTTNKAMVKWDTIAINAYNSFDDSNDYVHYMVITDQSGNVVSKELVEERVYNYQDQKLYHSINTSIKLDTLSVGIYKATLQRYSLDGKYIGDVSLPKTTYSNNHSTLISENNGSLEIIKFIE